MSISEKPKHTSVYTSLNRINLMYVIWKIFRTDSVFSGVSATRAVSIFPWSLKNLRGWKFYKIVSNRDKIAQNFDWLLWIRTHIIYKDLKTKFVHTSLKPWRDDYCVTTPSNIVNNKQQYSHPSIYGSQSNSLFMSSVSRLVANHISELQQLVGIHLQQTWSA